jgi:DNA-directed RNA polymerase subunit RPC12/RpoP
MTIDFTCQKCEASFELDAQDLIDGTEKLVCPHCDAKAPANLSEDFVAALAEMRVQIAVLGKKHFAVSLALETEDVEEDVDADEADEDESDDEDADEDLEFDEDDEDEADDDEDEDYDEEDSEER